MLVTEQVVAPLLAVAPASSAESWHPVAAILHVAQSRPTDSFLTVLPEDANGTVRGARRSTWVR